MFNTRLKALRKEKKLNQDELAKIIGVTTTTISFYETGDSLPSAEKLKIMAEFFGVSMDYLMGVTESPMVFEQHIDDRLRDFFKTSEFVAVFHDFSEWTVEDKEELLNYAYAKQMARAMKKNKLGRNELDEDKGGSDENN